MELVHSTPGYHLATLAATCAKYPLQCRMVGHESPMVRDE
jgi:hypothetical protein